MVNTEGKVEAAEDILWFWKDRVLMLDNLEDDENADNACCCNSEEKRLVVMCNSVNEESCGRAESIERFMALSGVWM